MSDCETSRKSDKTDFVLAKPAEGEKEKMAGNSSRQNDNNVGNATEGAAVPRISFQRSYSTNNSDADLLGHDRPSGTVATSDAKGTKLKRQFSEVANLQAIELGGKRHAAIDEAGGRRKDGGQRQPDTDWIDAAAGTTSGRYSHDQYLTATGAASQDSHPVESETAPLTGQHPHHHNRMLELTGGGGCSAPTKSSQLAAIFERKRHLSADGAATDQLLPSRIYVDAAMCRDSDSTENIANYASRQQNHLPTLAEEQSQSSRLDTRIDINSDDEEHMTLSKSCVRFRDCDEICPDRREQDEDEVSLPPSASHYFKTFSYPSVTSHRSSLHPREGSPEDDAAMSGCCPGFYPHLSHNNNQDRDIQVDIKTESVGRTPVHFELGQEEVIYPATLDSAEGIKLSDNTKHVEATSSSHHHLHALFNGRHANHQRHVGGGGDCHHVKHGGAPEAGGGGTNNNNGHLSTSNNCTGGGGGGSSQQLLSSSLHPKSIMRQRTYTNCQLKTDEQCTVMEDDFTPRPNRFRTRHPTYGAEELNSREKLLSRPRERNYSGGSILKVSGSRGGGTGLKLSIPENRPEPDFPELDPRLGPFTAPVKENEIETRRTFSFGGAMMTGSKHRHRKMSRQMTISGDTPLASIQSSYLSRSVSRAISRNLTLASVTDGSNSTIQIEEWKPIFDKFDLEADGKLDGKIPLAKFAAILDSDWKDSVPQSFKDKIIKEVDINNDGVIDYEEFLQLVKGKNLGLGKKRRRAFRQLLKETVEFIVPYKYTYQNEYKCSPLPWFMVFLSILQIVIFVYNSYQEIGNIGLYGPVPYCSHIIYNPIKRREIWRYLTYSLVHSGLFHVSFNILVQLMLGLPLEMVHGWFGVAAVYISGVIAGSLWTSVVKPGVFLCGGSGGVYALITSHLSTVVMNHREMSHPWVRVVIVSMVALTDIIVYFYEAAILGQPAKPVSYPAHIAGAISGLLVGLAGLRLRHLSWDKKHKCIRSVSLICFTVLVLVALVWNLADPDHFTTLPLQFNCTNSLIII